LSTFQTMWITKAEYQENGAEIVHKKCFWFDDWIYLSIVKLIAMWMNKLDLIRVLTGNFGIWRNQILLIRFYVQK
jgi:hypothetical protein